MCASHLPLPALNDEAQIELFANDSVARQRYRLLRAVLLDGHTQRRAAAAEGVSERTVRNVVSIYRRTNDLAALRTQRRRRGATAMRHEAFTAALSTALEEEPAAGGDRLWRRARALLGEQGSALSRRTAYRILAQLRTSARARARADDVALVRSALPLLVEDPPLGLGATALARAVLPDEQNQLARGAQLQRALRAALDRLRPSANVASVDRSWWPYLICSGEYEGGQSRSDLQRALALSPSTYSRAKREGLCRIAHLLPQTLASIAEAPIALQQIPRTPDFVGRGEEQAYYAWRLQTEGLAHIWGLPGSGKTALAAEIAAEGRRYGQRVLWHTCRPGAPATLAGIVSGLEQALAGVGDEIAEHQRTVEVDRSLEQRVDGLRAALLKQPALVVLDEVDRADETDRATLLELLRDLASQRAIRLLLVGRTRPHEGSWQPLQGLAEHEALLIWSELPPLPADQWAALYTATAGLPQPLRRAAAAYRRANEPADWRVEIEQWARRAIWQQLDERVQRLLAVLSSLDPSQTGALSARILEVLDLTTADLDQMQHHDLVSLTGTQLSIHPVLRSCAAALLREDAALRALAATL